MSSSPLTERPAHLALVLETVRDHRVGTIAWVAGGGVAMFAMALGLESEMARFPGGRQALAESIRPSAEAMKVMRWPAERLDTLGGYLTFHNITLFTLFLCIYGAVQGARAIRGGEDRHSLEEVLATGWSRVAVVRDRVVGFLVTAALISLGLGVAVGASMAAGGEPDLGGSLITMAATGLVAVVGYALGLLVSQLTATSRAAAGLATLVVTALYVGTNIADDIGTAGLVRYLSPFHYANASRALVPGYGFDLPASLALVVMAALLVGLATWAFLRRDYGAPLWRRRARAERMGRAPRVQRPALRHVWSATLLRGRTGLLVWSLSGGALTFVMAALEPSFMEAWEDFGFVRGLAGGEESLLAQFNTFASELVTPVVAAYVVTQAAGWANDLGQGRVEMMLATPLSWTRLVWERILAVVVGGAVITLVMVGGLLVGTAAVGNELDAAGLARLTLDSILLTGAVAGVAALVMALVPTAAAVTTLAVVVGASYLLVLLVPMLGWPEWINRLSVFGAFAHPYLEWPPAAGLLMLASSLVLGGLAAALVAERSPKVA
jgi:ABC-2 type transport system permease protein